MKAEDFRLEMQKLEKEFLVKKNSLNIKYFNENKKYKIGDFIIGRSTKETIEVLEIKYKIDEDGLPEAVYYGKQVKKDLTPMKKDVKCRIIESLAEPVKINP